jgi:Protein of unknown function (DUF4238)
MGWVWVYEKGKRPRESSTERQGFEKGYFGFVKRDGTLDESFENKLAELESRCNDALVSAKSRLCDLNSRSFRQSLAFYIGLLFARSTVRRKFSAGNWARMQEPFAKLEFNDEYVQDLAAHFSEANGELVTPETIREMIRKQAASFVEKQNTGNTFIQDLLFHAETMQQELLPRPWHVLEAPDGSEFATSDNPTVTFIKIREDLWNPGHGFRKPNVIIAFPLASSACLTIGGSGPDFQPVDVATVLRMNEVVVSCCDRFVYSKTLSGGAQKLMDTMGGWSVPGKTAFLGEPVGTEKIEEHLRKTMGIRRGAANGGR